MRPPSVTVPIGPAQPGAAVCRTPVAGEAVAGEVPVQNESAHFAVFQRLIARMIPASGTFVNSGEDTAEVRLVNGWTTLHCLSSS